ncbi:hypothetical protein GQ56_0132095 [Burkholderia paludis]|uniref:CHASE2 domain-containing protein n=1 Tax=Burkholderia paludis TaxID=1506587 RepID=UPI0004DB8E0E|nr:CHASE2 domain-containing protein [Burkholderia paludis]KFG93407.1 hypothetical protein GQ56_0132095 [Burkholderia paludis]
MGRRFVVECLLIALLIPPLLWWLHGAPGVRIVDAMLYDRIMSRRQVAPSPDILIVGIDARSLAAIGPWPWPRSVHARLLDTLARDGAARVLLGTFLDSASDEDDDRQLASSMARLPVYLPMRVATGPSAIADGTPTFVPPLPLFARSAAGTGHANVAVDGNGLSRWMFMREGPPGRLEPYVGARLVDRADAEPTPPAAAAAPAAPAALVTFAGLAVPTPPVAPAALAVSADHGDPTASGDAWIRQAPFGFPLAQPLHGWRTVSYLSLLRGQVPAAFVRGKLVLVGALEDARLERPVSIGTPHGVASLSGIELQAAAIDALRHDRTVRPLSRAAFAGWASLPVWIALLLFLPAARYGWAVVLTMSGLWLVVCLTLVIWAYVWVPPLPTLLGIAVAYFLWSWRRLSAFFHFFGRRIALLNALPAGAFEPADRPPTHAWDHVASRMAELDAAIDRIARIKTMLDVSISQMPVAVLVCLDDGTITQSNDAARRLLESPGEPGAPLDGRNLSSVLRGFDAPAPHASSAGVRWFDTLQHEYVTRRDHAFSPRIAALDGHGGEPRRWMVALHDVTNEHRLEREREQWIGYISHDLRTPQINIISLLNLHAAGAAPPDARGLVDGVRRETERSIRLADSILDLVTARSSRYRFELAPVASIMLDAVDQVWATASARGVAIDLHIADDDTALHADGALLTRAFVNLLHNAIRHSAPGTTIDLCAAVDEDASPPRLHVAVRDEGEGMAPERAAGLFDGPAGRFAARTQEDGPLTRHEIRSHGMGLAIVAEVVARHGGCITAFSRPGHGATFLLAFPLPGAPAR